MPREQLLIAGEWRPSADGAEFETTDPSSGELLAVCAEAGAADVDDAVQAARAALESPAWSSMLPAVRARLLWRVADLIEANGDELAELETRDQGQPLAVARAISVPAAAEHFRYYAGWCTKIEGSVPAVGIPQVMAYTRREPVGVCALDHAVELPADDRRVEARARPRVREHRDPQARRADPADRRCASAS